MSDLNLRIVLNSLSQYLTIQLCRNYFDKIPWVKEDTLNCCGDKWRKSILLNIEYKQGKYTFRLLQSYLSRIVL